MPFPLIIFPMRLPQRITQRRMRKQTGAHPNLPTGILRPHRDSGIVLGHGADPI
jgi:hypothetical protein